MKNYDQYNCKLGLILIFIMSSLSICAQVTIEGYVYDGATKLPLEGVSVYYNGTTIGVVTNTEGYFKIDTEKNTDASLIINSIGYQTKMYTKEEAALIKNIFLKEEITTLDEVVVTNDDWPREKKMSVFIKQFFGDTKASEYCKIINKETIKLRYISGENQLIGYSDEPIIIKNNYLGYVLYYKLEDFTIQYKRNASGINSISYVYYSGLTRFKELNLITKNKHIRSRRRTYKGSMLNFMRSLSTKTLRENNFAILRKTEDTYKHISTYAPFNIEDLNSKKVKVTILEKESIEIRYNNKVKSYIEVNGTDATFYIDEYGLFSPIVNLKFNGDFSNKRIATMLPANYSLPSL